MLVLDQSRLDHLIVIAQVFIHSAASLLAQVYKDADVIVDNPVGEVRIQMLVEQRDHWPPSSVV